MRKILLFAVLLLGIGSAKAQEVIDNFNVGPYEVDYKGQGDVNFRLRKDVDLYKYFNLKKDTIVQITKEEVIPFTSGIQLDLTFSLPRYGTRGANNVFGIDASWKKKIGKSTSFNVGLLFAMAFGKYSDPYLDENMIEIGVPISLEFGKISRNKSSLYCSVGIVPTFYSTTKSDHATISEETAASNHLTRSGQGGENSDSENKFSSYEDKHSGIFIAPRVDFGAYIPVGKQLLRLGVYGQYNINCSSKNYDQFKEHIGRAFVGVNLGLVL